MTSVAEIQLIFVFGPSIADLVPPEFLPEPQVGKQQKRSQSEYVEQLFDVNGDHCLPPPLSSVVSGSSGNAQYTVRNPRDVFAESFPEKSNRSTHCTAV